MQERFHFITIEDNLPIKVILSTNKKKSVPYVATFATDYPLFPIIIQLNKILNDVDLVNPATIDAATASHLNKLANLLNEALLKFQKNGKITLKGNEAVETFINAIDLITELVNKSFLKTSLVTNELVRQSPNSNQELAEKFRHKFMEDLLLPAQELFLNFSLNFKKILVIKNKKSKLEEIIYDFISETSAGVAIIYFSVGYFHQAEIHCKNAIAWSGKIKDLQRVQQQAFPLKLTLAKIYFEFGYFEVTLNLIREIRKIVEKNYLSDFDGTLATLIDFLEDKFLPFYENINGLIVLETCQNALTLLNIAIQKGCNNQGITSRYQSVQVIFAKAQEKCLANLMDAIKNSRASKKMISCIKHDFNQHYLLISLKNSQDVSILSRSLRAVSIQTEIISGQIKVDLYHCHPKLLVAACEKSLVNIEREAQLAKARAETPQRVVEPINLGNFRSAPTPISQTTSTTPTAKKEPEKIPAKTSRQTNKKLASSKKTDKNPANEAMLEVSPAEQPCIIYHWPKTGLTYNAKEGNQGTVKMLSSDDKHTPDGVYFGYMPDYVLKQEHYHAGFGEKLTSGKIHKQCIRWITKEMQNLGKSACFLFKIVIARHDARIYAWIEDICIDQDGKKHFLVCFGLISDHKLKNLPKNPQKQKDKMIKGYNKIQAIKQQLPTEDMVKNFLNVFTETIYDEAMVIPDQIKIRLQQFLTELTSSAYVAKKELASEKITTLFCCLLAMNTLLLKLGHQPTEPQQQLSIVQEILQLLFPLVKQEAYSAIIQPLVGIFQAAEDYYIIETKQCSASANDSEKKLTDDQVAEQLLTQLNQVSAQIETSLSNFEKIESTKASGEAVEKEKTTSDLNKFSSTIT